MTFLHFHVVLQRTARNAPRIRTHVHSHRLKLSLGDVTVAVALVVFFMLPYW